MDEEFVKVAAEQRKNAYAPYSNYKVSSVIKGYTDDNRVLFELGTNVENASYGLTICAERSAIFRAVASGMRRIGTLVCITEDGKGTSCGACRQVIKEFADEDTIIQYADKNGNIISTYTIDELLPDAFDPDRLGKHEYTNLWEDVMYMKQHYYYCKECHAKQEYIDREAHLDECSLAPWNDRKGLK